LKALRGFESLYPPPYNPALAGFFVSAEEVGQIQSPVRSTRVRLLDRNILQWASFPSRFFTLLGDNKKRSRERVQTFLWNMIFPHLSLSSYLTFLLSSWLMRDFRTVVLILVG